MVDQRFQECFKACIECAQACEYCASACLSESNVDEMAGCIRLDRDCAEACWTASAWMSRESQFATVFCQLCAEVCTACGNECRKHAANHCQRCADACERCADACRRMSGAAA